MFICAATAQGKCICIIICMYAYCSFAIKSILLTRRHERAINVLYVLQMMSFFSEESLGALLGSPFQSEASSPLRFHPYTERDDFMEYDYHFQRSCCFSESDNMCPTYTNQRRADECLSYTPSEFGKSLSFYMYHSH